MFNTGLLKWLLPIMGLMSFAGEGEGGSEGDKGKEKGGDKGKPAEGETVSKSDYDKLTKDFDTANQNLEDMRLEVMSPEYLEFLDDKEKGGDKGKEKEGAPAATDKTLGDEDFEKLSKKELFEKAKDAAKTEMKGEIEDVRKNHSTTAKAQTQREIGAFSRAHEDYEQYRPVMYGLSLDPKKSNWTLQELYDEAKAYVVRVHTGTTDKEKEKQQKAASEKPGGSTVSYEELAKKSSEEATSDALKETKDKLGITEFPSA